MLQEKKEKVVVAMSGGVDSSVALALLKEQGYDCVGVSMQLWDYSGDNAAAEGEAEGGVAGGCCSLEDIYDARRVAHELDVPFYVLNMKDDFEKEVVDYFTESYMHGKTPNPCVKCNEVLKFDFLRRKAGALGAKYLATGHYARIKFFDGSPALFKGVDKTKDQSYFLFTMTEAQLKGTLFPLGAMTKAEVRDKARRMGLKTSEKKESQEICFVEHGSYGDFIASRAGGAGEAASGAIMDRAGKILGTHKGLFHYTIGQRKGLGLGGSNGPFYVQEIDTMNNCLVVGPVDELYSRGLRAKNITYTGLGKGEDNENAVRALMAPGIKARIRYGFEEVPCRVSINTDESLTVEFEQAQKSVTPGQAVVFYRGEKVIGGGWIEEALF